MRRSESRREREVYRSLKEKQVLGTDHASPDRAPCDTCRHPGSRRSGRESLAQVYSPAAPDTKPGPNASQQNPSATTQTSQPSAQDIANQVNNPAAPVTLIQFSRHSSSHVAGTNGVATTLQMQPVIPVGPFPAFPVVQLIKLTLPLYVSVPGPIDQSGLGDLQLFDLISFKQSWGRWGFGPALFFPTASNTALGSGKGEAGPAFGAFYTGIKNLTAGAIVQNPVSYAGSPQRPNVNQMLVTPTLTYNRAEGWFMGITDYNWAFDWTNSGAATITVGLQVGKVARLGKQPVGMAFEAAKTVAKPASALNPGWVFGFELSPISISILGLGRPSGCDSNLPVVTNA
jgi:hypothetical protein